MNLPKIPLNLQGVFVAGVDAVVAVQDDGVQGAVPHGDRRPNVMDSNCGVGKMQVED